MILVVDNDPSFLERAREILNRTRQVFLASNAERAFELAGTLGFSVALVDLDLAGDGLELIRKLHLAVPDLLIIAMRSKVQKHGFLNDIQELGVVEVLDKPITQEWKPVVENVRAAHARGNPPTPP